MGINGANSVPATAMAVRVSEDKLQAELQITVTGPPPPVQDIVRFLHDSGVRVGISIGAIEELRADAQRASVGDQVSRVIAQGKPMEPGIDGRIEHLVKEPERVRIGANGRADYRNISKFQVVEEGQPLARQIPPVEGKPGLDVRDQEIPPPKLKNPRLKPGNNVEFDEATLEYRAQCKGIYRLTNRDEIFIEPTLVIHADVGMETGNIYYFGDVQVYGNIERGSSLSCQKDLAVAGLVETGNIQVAGNMAVKRGINSGTDEAIIVRRNLRCDYINNSKLIVGGNVSVHNSILASRIIAYGGIRLTGEKSVVAGGYYTAYTSLSTGNLGNRIGNPTKVVLGINAKHQAVAARMEEKLAKIKTELTARAEKVKALQNYVTRMRGKVSPEKAREVEVEISMYKKLIKMQEDTKVALKEARQKTYNNDPVKVIVRGILYPGVEIFFRHETVKITESQSSCVYIYEPQTLKVTQRAYQPALDDQPLAPTGSV